MDFSKSALKAVNRTVGRFLPAGVLAFRYSGVPGRIHVDDQMLRSAERSSVDHYVRTGQEAVELVEWAAGTAGRRLADVSDLLILPSGYGRVIRHLVMTVPCDRITACDVDPQAVRFCNAEFGVRTLLSCRDLGRLALPGSYDVIFVGSLLTHLPPEDGVTLLERLVSVLGSGGQLIFTTQGESCLTHLDWYGASFAEAEARYRADVAQTGVGFAAYPHIARYGITIHSSSYVERLIRKSFPSLQLLGLRERGWDAHQDVWAWTAT